MTMLRTRSFALRSLRPLPTGILGNLPGLVIDLHGNSLRIPRYPRSDWLKRTRVNSMLRNKIYNLAQQKHIVFLTHNVLFLRLPVVSVCIFEHAVAAPARRCGWMLVWIISYFDRSCICTLNIELVTNRRNLNFE